MIRPPHALGLRKRQYWRFLRDVYGLGALEAWTTIERAGIPPSLDELRRAIWPRNVFIADLFALDDLEGDDDHPENPNPINPETASDSRAVSGSTDGESDP